MRLYLAGTTTDAEYLRVIRARIRALGHEVTSDWLDTAFAYSDTRCTAKHLKAEAPRDLAQIRDCDVFVLNRRHKSVGKFVELGMALACGKRVWLVGPSEVPCAFYGMAEHVFPNWCAVFAALDPDGGKPGMDQIYSLTAPRYQI